MSGYVRTYKRIMKFMMITVRNAADVAGSLSNHPTSILGHRSSQPDSSIGMHECRQYYTSSLAREQIMSARVEIISLGLASKVNAHGTLSIFGLKGRLAC